MTPIQEGEDDENITTLDTYTLKFQSPSSWTSFPSRIPEILCTKHNVTDTYGVRFGSSLYGWKNNFITFQCHRIQVHIISESSAIDNTRRHSEFIHALKSTYLVAAAILGFMFVCATTFGLRARVSCWGPIELCPEGYPRSNVHIFSSRSPIRVWVLFGFSFPRET